MAHTWPVAGVDTGCPATPAVGRAQWCGRSWWPLTCGEKQMNSHTCASAGDHELGCLIAAFLIRFCQVSRVSPHSRYLSGT